MLDPTDLENEVALCLTLVQQPDDLAIILPRLGYAMGDLIESAPDRSYELADEAAHDVLHFLRVASGDLVVVEVNGYQGTRPRVLEALAGAEGGACSVFWNVNMKADFNAYMDGRHTRLDCDDLYDPDYRAPAPLRIAEAEMRAARARDEYGTPPLLRAWLAQTGGSLPSDLMTRELPALVATRLLPESPSASSQPARVEGPHSPTDTARWAQAFLSAPLAVRRTAINWMTDEVLRRLAGSPIPTVRTAAAQLRPAVMPDQDPTERVREIVQRVGDAVGVTARPPLPNGPGWRETCLVALLSEIHMMGSFEDGVGPRFVNLLQVALQHPAAHAFEGDWPHTLNHLQQIVDAP